MKVVCFACNVHAHRAIQETVDRCSDPRLHRWAIGTRNARTFEDVDAILAEMSKFGDNWMSFSNWLKKNICNRILWFTYVYITTTH